MRRRWVAGGVAAASAVAAAAGALAGAGGNGERASEAAAASPEVATEAVQRRDLVDRETVTGTLRYADERPLVAGVAGVLTRLRAEGETVGRGEWLYEVDGKRTGWLLYGRRPAWRDLGPSVADGADVRQLEANLAALGYQPGDVDGDWDADTTAAVRAFQEDRDLVEDGTLARGEILFRRGRTRIGTLSARLGAELRPGMELGSAASTRREVEIDLEADRQTLAREGAAVTVELPDGTQARGRIAEVGAVAEKGKDGVATVSVRVELRGKRARGSGLDQAPVDVGLEAERAKDALAVPVTALLARSGGGYAVEVVGRGLVPVEPGLFADGLVAVAGDLRAGEKVVVPA